MADPRASASVDSRAHGQQAGGGDSQVAARGPRGAKVLAVVLRLAGSRVVRWSFVLGTAGLGAYAIVSNWDHLQAGFSRLGFAAVVTAFVCILINLLAQMEVYRALLAGLGSPLPMRSAAQILFVGQLGKYLPGSVWPVLAQMELGSAHRVPRSRSASAAILAMVLSLAVGILVALVMLPVGGGAGSYWWVFLFAPVAGLCLYPRLTNRILNLALRAARQPPLERPLGRRSMAVALAWAAFAWIALGLQIWFLAARLGLHGWSGPLLAIGSFAFAWCAGFIVIFAPAGAGIREVVLIALLAVAMSRADAAVVALVSRALMTIGDLASAGIAAWFARRSRRSRPVRTPADSSG
jgi:glycosyltransferase 2 family protein